MLHTDSAAMCQAGQGINVQKLHLRQRSVKGSFYFFRILDRYHAVLDIACALLYELDI